MHQTVYSIYFATLAQARSMKGEKKSFFFRLRISNHSLQNMSINLGERQPLRATTETPLAAVRIQSHQSSFSCGA